MRHDIEMGKAAYINQLSGNTGGLAGAFEIDLLKQEENFAEIASRTIKAIEKMGAGSPTTLQDVKENPALAGQLYQQRELVKQFGLANSDQEAYRVLELLKAGGGQELEKVINSIKDPQDAMIDALNIGNELAKGANNTLIKLHNAVERAQRLDAQNVRGGLEKLDSFVGGNEIQENVVENSVTGHVVSAKESLRPKDVNARINEIKNISNINEVTKTNEINRESTVENIISNARGRDFDQVTDQMSTSGELLDRVEDSAKYVTRMFSIQVDDIINKIGNKVNELKLDGGPPDKLLTTLQNKTEKAISNEPQKVQLDGELKVQVDITSEMKNIARVTAREEFVNMQKEQAKQGFTGVK